MTCIVNSEAQVVISPTDLKPFLQLDSIFKSGGDTKAAQAVRKMKEALSQQQSGVFQFTATNELRLVMSYHPLGVNDWILLTLVPADLISGEANFYIFRAFLIVAGVSLLFALFLALSIRFYRKNRKQLEKIAFTDQLTGGMNNAAFQLKYQKLAETMCPGTYVVIMLNVKGFKFINENFGIVTGNDILKHIYGVLKRHIGEGELFARSEADHFFLCLKENEQEKIQWRLDGMISEINSFTLDSDIHYSITILQGAYLIDEPELHIGIIQDRARVVCQETKCLFYSSDITQKTKNEHELNALFEDSIENHDFHVVLQPKVRLADGAIGGAEALVRWIHPQRGMIYPSDFIPIFEKSDKIYRLDLYVFEEVCKWLKGQMDNGHSLFPISVNLSRRHFKNPNFLRSFSELKEKYTIPDKMIEFELTESIFFEMQQIEFVKNAINQIHRYGFLCSLDDFGVGFSSLALLNQFDVDTIKLDRQFFGDIANEKTQNVVASFIALADKLKIHIVAEGIETEEQLNYLRAMHCDMVQGYIFSKPLSISDFEKWCANMQKNNASN